MSYDPIFNQSSITTRGDIGVGFGMLGLTTRLITANGTPISHVPGSDFSNYFSHYNVEIQANTDFTLAPIAVVGGVSVGYTMCIDAMVTAPTDPEPVLRVFDTFANQIGEIESGGKIFLVAATPTEWKAAYAVPEGRNNWLLVYTGPYPKVRLLPIKKEFDYNGNFEYGIKSIDSFDFTEPTNLVDVTNYTNPNRIIIEGSTNTDATIANINAPVVHSFISCDSCDFISNAADGGSISSLIACYDTSGIEQIKDCKGIVQIACQQCNQDNSTSPSRLGNSLIAASSTCEIRTNGSNVAGMDLRNSLIAGSVNVTYDVTPLGGSSEIASIATNGGGIISCTSCATAGTISSGLFNSVASSAIGSSNASISNCVKTIIIGSQGCTIDNVGGSVGGSAILQSNASDIDGTIEGLIVCSSTCSATNGNNVYIGASTSHVSLTDVNCSFVGTDNNTQDNTTFAITASSGAIHKGNFTGSDTGGHLNAMEDTTGVSIVSSTATSITGDASTVYSGVTGWANIASGVTVLSSHNMTPDFTAGDYRYLVMGGFNAPTWSIDSKTGNYYGNTFTPGQALPGFAEMFPNLILGTILVGRLLQIENGAVRLARDGETGFMISRPFATAAFVGGNPYLGWHKMFKTDVFGNKLTAEYSADEYMEVLRKTGKSESAIKQLDIKPGQYTFGVLNPDYDSAIKYLPRSERLGEWTCCEKSGIVIVELADADISTGDYLISGIDGKAKKSNRITNVKVLEVLNGFAKVDISNQYLPERATVNATTTAGDSTLTFANALSLQDFSVKSFIVTLKSRRKLKLKLRFNASQALYDTLSADLYSASNVYEFDLSAKKRKGNLVVIAELSEIVEAGQYTVRIMPSAILAISMSIKLG